jgi:hypothetical protein
LNRRLRGLTATTAGGAAGLGILASCTVFDGATVRAADAGRMVGSDGSTVITVDGSDSGAVPLRFLELEEGVRLCAKLNTCPLLATSTLASTAIPFDSLNASVCLDWASGPLPPSRVGTATQAETLRCIAQAKDCAEAGRCLPVELLSTVGAECSLDGGAEAGASRCSGDGKNVLYCGPGPTVFHCEAPYFGPGSKCVVGDDGLPTCGIDRTCVPDVCDGNQLTFCSQGGVQISIVCAVSGFTCGTDPDAGRPDCLSGGRVTRCQGLGASCRGTKLVACDGVSESQFDCGELGGTCSESGGTAVCTRKDAVCTPFDTDVNVCEEGAIVACVGGKKTRYTCATAGLRCVPRAGSRTAHCE